jgi:integrase
MQVTFSLHNKSYVYASVYADDGRVYMSIKQRCNVTLSKAPREVTNNMNAINLAVEDHIVDCKRKREPIKKADIERLILSMLPGKKKYGVGLCESIDRYITLLEEGKEVREDGKKASNSTIVNLRNGNACMKGTKLEHISIEAFSPDNLRTLQAIMIKKGLSKNTISAYNNAVVYFFSFTYKRWHQNDLHKQDGVSYNREKIDHAIYYKVPQIERIYREPLTGIKKTVRDMFVYGCFTCMRISDHLQHDEFNITPDYIVIPSTIKRGKEVVIPLHPIVREMLLEYGGKPPKVSEDVFSRYIRVICRDIKGDDGKPLFHDTVFFRRTEGGEVKTRLKTRWQMTTSHTMRRSFVTNARLAGMPDAYIMSIGGWSSAEAYHAYVRSTALDVAEQAAKHPFFSGKTA